MSVASHVFSRQRLILTTVALLVLAGLASWFTMPRQEDPTLPSRWGSVLVFYPGADATTVERLVVEPLEEQLAEVEEIRQIDATAQTGIATLIIELANTVYETDKAWDRVENALNEVVTRGELPEAATHPRLNRSGGDVESVVLALTGPANGQTLVDTARILRRELLTVDGVSRISLIGDPGEQVTVELDDAVSRRLALPPRYLAAQLDSRNRSLPAGVIHVSDRTMAIRTHSDFKDLDELANTPIVLASGAALPLRDIAKVHVGPAAPALERMRYHGRQAIGLGIVAREGIDLVLFGQRIRDRIAALSGELAPVQVSEIAFQPDNVRTRITSLGTSLILGIFIVATVLVLLMGVRLGLVVSSVVPLVAFSSLAIFAMTGGVLHQISIAALVIALGLLVDNAIVVAENVQRSLDRGEAALEATKKTITELSLPLATATGTTLAAFIPMLLASGDTADFTRSLPIVIMITLTVSYLFAVMLTPILAAAFLKPRVNGERWQRWSFSAVFNGASQFTVRRPWVVLAITAILIVATTLFAGRVRSQFFPISDRTTVLVDLALPEGSHIDEIDSASLELERVLAQHPEVASTTTFIGRGAPRFYYNINSIENQPQVAQMMIDVTSTESVQTVIHVVRELAAEHIPQVSVVARPIEQGPPVGAPVQIRLSGSSLSELHSTAETLLEILQSTSGTADVRHDFGTGAPVMHYEVNDAAAARTGLSRSDVALALLGQTRGLDIGRYRGGDDPIPILIRSSAGENTAPENLGSVDIARSHLPPVPVEHIATGHVEWRPVAIRHHNRSRTVTISAQLAPGATFSDVLARVRPQLSNNERLEAVTAGRVRLEMGGEAEGADEANSALLRTLPIGLLLLLGVLLAEFNSFRRVLIILSTVPLATTGIIPGLIVFDQPFGFMSLLGVFALLGIVVNNAIVLLDVVDRQLESGASLNEALRTAVELRVRPILLTTATTVAGLIPLLLSPSTLWSPLASAMISGLLASSLLTLFVVPALSRLLLDLKLPGIASPAFQ